MAKIRKTEGLWHALGHHAKELQPIVGTLSTGILVDLQPLGWELVQTKEGPQSFSLRRGGVEYHFRPTAGLTQLVVYDRWFHDHDSQNVVATLKTRVDTIKFIRMVAAQGKPLKAVA